jgi:hypothetical protein
MNLFRTMTAGMILGTAVLAGGCQYNRNSAVPASAVMAGESSGYLSYRAGSDGTVYVINRTKDKVVFSGPIMKGQTVVVDSQKNQVMVEDRIVSENSLVNGDVYRIYFLADRDRNDTL